MSQSCVVVGIRPQFIHLFGLLVEKALPDDILIVDIGQHFSFNMSQIFRKELELPHMVSLNMQAKDSERNLVDFITKKKVSKVYVMGDSRTTVMGAIAAKATHAKLVHIEAGLRCNELIPEEVNRRFVDAVSDELWCPTVYAVENLKRENVNGTIRKTENFRVSAFRKFVQKVEAIPYDVVCEFHRQDNVDNPKRFSIIRNTLIMSKKKIFWSVHPRITAKYASVSSPFLTASSPLSYMDWLKVLKGADVVVTDSGGIQLEAYELNKKIISLRCDVEWKHTLNRTIFVGDNLEQLEKELENCG